MKENGWGVMPLQTIRQFLADGYIIGALPKNISAASLDLTISQEIFRLEGIFQPKPGEKVRSILTAVGALPHSLDCPLEQNVVYLARLNECLKLPEQIYGYCNPRSTTGRCGILVRVLADGVPLYDAATPQGFQGELWLAISPKAFPVKLNSGNSLSQIRFFNADTRTKNDAAILRWNDDYGLLHPKHNQLLLHPELKISDRDGTLIFTVDLEDEIVGWEYAGASKVLDFSRKNYYQPEDFFRPLHSSNGFILLKRNGFYLLHTKQKIRVPPALAAEATAMDARFGEFRSHFAGFIDPGYGWDNGQGMGRSLTLEIRPDEDLLLRDDQIILKVKFEKMVEIPEINHDSCDSSYYLTDKNPNKVWLLSKHFQKIQ